MEMQKNLINAGINNFYKELESEFGLIPEARKEKYNERVRRIGREILFGLSDLKKLK